MCSRTSTPGAWRRISTCSTRCSATSRRSPSGCTIRRRTTFSSRGCKLRRPDAAPLLDRLHAEHEQGRVKFAELKAALDEYHRDAKTLPSFVERVERYSHFHWLHMRREEDEVLPLAAAALTAEDWAGIDAAFASNSDPVVGISATREFRTLFRRIVALAPPPLGVGPEAPGRK